MHKTIKKMSEDIENIKFNTAVAALMEWLNYLSAKGNLSTSFETRVQSEEYETFLLLLAPFAPHITEELWSGMGQKYSIHQQSWPAFDNKYLEDQQILLIVQINGKLRDVLKIAKDIVSNKEAVEEIAKGQQKVKKYLAGARVEKVVYISGKVINFVTKVDK